MYDREDSKISFVFDFLRLDVKIQHQALVFQMGEEIRPVNENERELERIFEEKLYVSKKASGEGRKKPLTDVSNFVPKAMESKVEKGGNYERGEDSMIDVCVPKETVLEGVYDDFELREVFETKERMKEVGLEDFRDEKKEKVKRLEREFESLIQTHKDTLKMKSKVYRFIYNEIHNLRGEFEERIEKLESENGRLTEEVKCLRGEIERMRGEFRVYEVRVSEKVNKWKKAVEAKVKDYLERRRV